MRPIKFSTLDLLDLPPLEREVFLRIARHGPASVDVLADDAGHDPDAVHRIIDKLVQDERLQVLADGRIDAVYGRISSRTTIPAALWPALATDRPYTKQEISTLRTAIPILQFARAKMGQFADHGPAHAMRVRSFAVQFSYLIGLTASERHLLRVGALFHDIGNVVERDRHHIISQQTVEKLAADGEIPFTSEEAEVIGLLCRWHRGEYDPDRENYLHGERIRTGLLASVLRVADAMDIDHRRSDYDDRFKKVLRLFFPHQLQYWTSLEEIGGVRIRSTSAIHLQVFTSGPATNNMQIAMLHRDLDATPLAWSVRQVAVAPSAAGAQQTRLSSSTTAAHGRSLIVFPFDAHSLVMAALSRNHLAATSDAIDLFCYPDTPDGPNWLWTGALAETDPNLYARLIVIGDRPDANTAPHLFETIRRWRATDAAVSILNRYEANWPRLPELIALGVDVTVGGDWAYFWGDAASGADLAWGRIAALSVRDPTLSIGGETPRELAVTNGLQKVVFDAIATSAPNNTDGWRSRAEPILARIEADDQTFFADHAVGFAETYTAAGSPGRIEGRVVVFDCSPGRVPQSFPWILEAAIERQGRVPERALRFNVPHAIAAWPDDDAVEILAITHWREEDALPIRLLYPEDVGPAPQGNEHALRVRVAPELAPVLLRMLIDACNGA